MRKTGKNLWDLNFTKSVSGWNEIQPKIMVWLLVQSLQKSIDILRREHFHVLNNYTYIITNVVDTSKLYS